MQLRTLGVVGAGPMGAGIAQIGLTAGLNVVLYDVNGEAAAKAGVEIIARIAKLEEKEKVAAGSAEAARARLKVAADLSAFAACELVVEAIIERLDVKQALFAQLEAIVTPQATLASNTSSLSIAAIASRCTYKARVGGMHFFNPVPLMKLVEVVAAPDTSAETVAFITAACELLGKTPVTVKDAPGFLVNLQGRAYALEGLAIAQEGVAPPAVIDRILKAGAGFRMGPFELMDLTGIDVNFAATTAIYEGYQHDPRLKTTPLHQLMANSGRFGRKSGRGFYDYSQDAPSAPSPAPPPQAVALQPRLAEPGAHWDKLSAATNLVAGDDVTLIAPIGEDCATTCARLGLDPKCTVAIDLTGIEQKHLTVMAAIGGSQAAARTADWLRCCGFVVEQIEDSPGFVLQRVIAMVANLGCELAQIGVSSPQNIDIAMKLAQNYPRGPLEWADWLGVAKTHEIMRQLHVITGSDRYRPSLWLRRRAQLGLPAHAV